MTSYRRYLQLVPNDGDAQADYGLTMDRASKSPRDSVNVFFQLEKALRFSPNRDDVRRRVVDIAMGFGRYTDAQDHLKKLLETSPDDAELECLLGRCLEATGAYGKAAEQFEQGKKHAPAKIENYIRLADLWRLRLNKARDTERLMEDMVKANPSAQAYVARARFYRLGGTGLSREGDTSSQTLLGFEEIIACFVGVGGEQNCLCAALAVQSGGGPDFLFNAEQDLRKARALRPDDVDVLLMSSDVARARKWLDQAEKYARRGLKMYPKLTSASINRSPIWRCSKAGRVTPSRCTSRAGRNCRTRLLSPSSWPSCCSTKNSTKKLRNRSTI